MRDAARVARRKRDPRSGLGISGESRGFRDCSENLERLATRGASRDRAGHRAEGPKRGDRAGCRAPPPLHEHGVVGLRYGLGDSVDDGFELANLWGPHRRGAEVLRRPAWRHLGLLRRVGLAAAQAYLVAHERPRYRQAAAREGLPVPDDEMARLVAPRRQVFGPEQLGLVARGAARCRAPAAARARRRLDGVGAQQVGVVPVRLLVRPLQEEGGRHVVEYPLRVFAVRRLQLGARLHAAGEEHILRPADRHGLPERDLGQLGQLLQQEVDRGRQRAAAVVLGQAAKRGDRRLEERRDQRVVRLGRAVVLDEHVRLALEEILGAEVAPREHGAHVRAGERLERGVQVRGETAVCVFGGVRHRRERDSRGRALGKLLDDLLDDTLGHGRQHGHGGQVPALVGHGVAARDEARQAAEHDARRLGPYGRRLPPVGNQHPGERLELVGHLAARAPIGPLGAVDRGLKGKPSVGCRGVGEVDEHELRARPFQGAPANRRYLALRVECERRGPGAVQRDLRRQQAAGGLPAAGAAQQQLVAFAGVDEQPPPVAAQGSHDDAGPGRLPGPPHVEIPLQLARAAGKPGRAVRRVSARLLAAPRAAVERPHVAERAERFANCGRRGGDAEGAYREGDRHAGDEPHGEFGPEMRQPVVALVLLHGLILSICLFFFDNDGPRGMDMDAIAEHSASIVRRSAVSPISSPASARRPSPAAFAAARSAIPPNALAAPSQKAPAFCELRFSADETLGRANIDFSLGRSPDDSALANSTRRRFGRHARNSSDIRSRLLLCPGDGGGGYVDPKSGRCWRGAGRCAGLARHEAMTAFPSLVRMSFSAARMYAARSWPRRRFRSAFSDTARMYSE